MSEQILSYFTYILVLFCFLSWAPPPEKLKSTKKNPEKLKSKKKKPEKLKSKKKTPEKLKSKKKKKKRLLDFGLSLLRIPEHAPGPIALYSGPNYNVLSLIHFTVSFASFHILRDI